MNKVQERFKKAREFFELSQRDIADKLDVTAGIVNHAESGKTDNPNFRYTKGLIELGINPFYLIGQSEEITGQLEGIVSRVKYEELENENEELQQEISKLQKQLKDTVSNSKFEQLLYKYEGVLESLKSLKLEVDENGELRKKAKK